MTGTSCVFLDEHGHGLWSSDLSFTATSTHSIEMELDISGTHYARRRKDLIALVNELRAAG